MNNNRPTTSRGILTLSLDFEMFWGVRDIYTTDSYNSHLAGVRDACHSMLDLFDKYGIHVTWATVGCMFAKDKQELMDYLPSKLPSYDDTNLSPYPYIESADDLESRFHFARDIIERISQQANQELATHTFSHYYCLENGQTLEEFESDIEAAVKIAAEITNTPMRSLVFPRNQYNPEYLQVIRKHGVMAYRGNEQHWLYQPRPRGEEQQIRRAFRLIDAYLNISGHSNIALNKIPYEQGLPVNVQASRYIRPYSTKLKALEPLRQHRIKQSMTAAAKAGHVYHLWGHPHDFGAQVTENMQFLEGVFQHYRLLQDKYGMQSLSMHAISQQVRQGDYSNASKARDNYNYGAEEGISTSMSSVRQS